MRSEQSIEEVRRSKRKLQALIRHSIPVVRASLNHSDGATRMAAVAVGLGALHALPEDAAPFMQLVDVVGNPPNGDLLLRITDQVA